MKRTHDEAHPPQLELTMKTTLHSLAIVLLASPALFCSAAIQQGEMAGYLFGPAEKVPEEFNAGFSLYAAAWPLVEDRKSTRLNSSHRT